jgi:hypothetical protein
VRHPEDYVVQEFRRPDPNKKGYEIVSRTIWSKRRQADKALRNGMSGRQWVKLRKKIQRAHRLAERGPQ